MPPRSKVRDVVLYPALVVLFSGLVGVLSAQNPDSVQITTERLEIGRAHV